MEFKKVWVITFITGLVYKIWILFTIACQPFICSECDYGFFIKFTFYLSDNNTGYYTLLLTLLNNNITDINCVGDKYTNGYTHIIIYDKLFYNFITFVFILIKGWNNYKWIENVLRGVNKYSSYNKIICVMLNMCSEYGYKWCSK